MKEINTNKGSNREFLLLLPFSVYRHGIIILIKETNCNCWFRQLGKCHVSELSFLDEFQLDELEYSAAHIGEKVPQLKNDYHERILMWCKEEKLDDGKMLTDVINKEHKNVKYLPDQKLPENVVAVPDLSEAVKDADILIFVLPHQYVKKTCEQLKGQVKKEAFALTLIKVRSTRNVSM